MHVAPSFSTMYLEKAGPTISAHTLYPFSLSFPVISILLIIRTLVSSSALGRFSSTFWYVEFRCLPYIIGCSLKEPSNRTNAFISTMISFKRISSENTKALSLQTYVVAAGLKI